MPKKQCTGGNAMKLPAIRTSYPQGICQILSHHRYHHNHGQNKQNHDHITSYHIVSPHHHVNQKYHPTFDKNTPNHSHLFICSPSADSISTPRFLSTWSRLCKAHRVPEQRPGSWRPQQIASTLRWSLAGCPAAKSVAANHHLTSGGIITSG